MRLRSRAIAAALSALLATAVAQAGELDPQAKALLDQMAKAYAASPPQPSPSTPAEHAAAYRAGYHQVDPLGGEPEAVANVINRSFAGPAGPVPVRIYVADTTVTGSRPLVLYYHGGGFIGGDLDTHDRLARQLANRSGAVIVSVAYRLAPEHPFPAANDDAYAALRWATSEARSLGADADRVVLVGDSAGGLISAATAIRARDERGPKVAKQILIYPNTDTRPGVHHTSWRTFDGMILNRAEMDQNLSYWLPAAVDGTQPAASPLLARDLRNLPPAVVITAEHDPLRDEAEAYARRLREAGVTVEATRYPGMIHGFAQMAGVLDAGKRVVNHIANEIRETRNAR